MSFNLESIQRLLDLFWQNPTQMLVTGLFVAVITWVLAHRQFKLNLEMETKMKDGYKAERDDAQRKLQSLEAAAHKKDSGQALADLGSTKRRGIEYTAFLENLEMVYVASLQAISLNDGLLEGELDYYLREHGFEAPENCLSAVINRTALAERDFEGRGRIKREFRTSVLEQLPRFELRSNERELNARIRALEQENEKLKAEAQH